LELRVDPDLGIISGDLRRAWLPAGEAEGVATYMASLRTEPGRALELALGSLVIIGEDDAGQVSTGRLQLAAGDAPNQLAVSVEFDRRLAGLPFRRPIDVMVAWSCEALRDVVIELETEAGVAPIADFSVNGSVKNVVTVFRDAGIDVVVGGLSSDIPAAEPSGWDDTEAHTMLEELHRLMEEQANAPLTGPAWHVSLLLLSRAKRRGLLGVMFDLRRPLPRQGAAVFATRIREIPGLTAPDRKVIQTVIHELGHALNLAHRFEREVGRADSLSHMNYDYLYKLGQDEFWKRYQFKFDPDELGFLRHGVRAHVMPGGSPFHSRRYWADGDGGYVPYRPEVPLPWLKLRLQPPPTPFFQFGQPVFVELSLQNMTAQLLDLPSALLDPKGAFVEVLIRRHRLDDPTGVRDANPFVGLAQRCYDMSAEPPDRLESGATITENLNLTFGSSGFSFAEPGFYDVTAFLVIPAEVTNQFIAGPPVEVEQLVSSNVLRIQVAYPTRVEEQDLGDLFDPEVGTYFALGGSPVLERAQAKLARIQERRGDDTGDPIVANIIRCAGINAQRSPVRYDADNKRFRQVPADLEEAARQLGRLDEPALANFDPTTARSTRALGQVVERGL
jgi:hypothetical protein